MEEINTEDITQIKETYLRIRILISFRIFFWIATFMEQKGN